MVRVDGEESRPPGVLARDLVQPALPGDDVRAVTAREDDRDGHSLVVAKRMRLAVDSRELERRRRIAEREACHALRSYRVGHPLPVAQLTPSAVVDSFARLSVLVVG